jgi:sulfite exporter TauE/SafE
MTLTAFPRVDRKLRRMILLLGVLAASVIGSIRCAASCGAFVCLYSGTNLPRGIAGLRAHAAYNGGRLASYASLGLAAGWIGGRIDLAGEAAGVARAAALLAGVLVAAWAIGIIASTLGVRLWRLGAPAWVRRHLGAVVLAVRNRPPVVRAAVTGLVTSLLPCGWLYTFVVTAGGTGRPITGALVMTMFWVGTVPAMLGVGYNPQRRLGRFARRLPLASAAIVFVLGLLSASGTLIGR